MNIEETVSAGCPRGSEWHGHCSGHGYTRCFWRELRDSGPPWSAVPGTGAGGDQSLASPRGPVSVVRGEQWRARTPGVLQWPCGVRVTGRARVVTAWALTWAGQLAVSLSQERDTAWLGAWHHMTVTWWWSLTSLCYCHHYPVSCVCHSCCQGSLPISELVLS